jgi:hypothetical protein
MAKRKTVKPKRKLKIRRSWLAAGGGLLGLAIVALATQLYFNEPRPMPISSSVSSSTPAARPLEFKKYKVAHKPAMIAKKSPKKKMIALKKKKRAVKVAGR